MTERLPGSIALLAVVLLAGCQTSPPPRTEMTDAERTEIEETIARLAATVDVKVDRAQCEAALEIFGDLEPVVASGGMTLRTVEDVKPMCPEGIGMPSRFDIAQSDAHVLSRDTAYIVRQGTMTLEPPDGPHRRLRYAVTHIFVRTGGDWKIAHHHESFQRIE